MCTDMKRSAIQADTHMHTVASTHAYSTVLELARCAFEAELKAIIITDHGPGLPDGAHMWHFVNMRNLPPYIYGVRVMHGAEANIMDFDGNIDLDERSQKELDWIIASFHEASRAPGTETDHTRAYLKVAENPYIDVIGHSGTEAFSYDYEKVLPVFKKKGKLIEINSHSFNTRKGADENCRTIAQICKKYEIPVVVNSDAHFCLSVGDVREAFKMLDSIDFPPSLILNLDYSNLVRWIENKRNRKIV